MKQLHKACFAICLAVILTFVFGMAQAHDIVRIACIARSNSKEYWQDAIAGAMDAAEVLDAEVFALYVATDNDSGTGTEMLRMLDIALISGANVVVVQGRNDEAFVEKIMKLRERGVFIIFWDCDHYDSSLRDVYVGIDNIQAGIDLAEHLMRQTGDGKVFYPETVKNSVNFIQRREGLLQAFEAADVECIYLEVDSATPVLEETEYEKYLKSHEDIVGLISNNENITLRYAQMLLRNNWQDRIKLVGFDISEEILECMQQGAIEALIIQNSYAMGYRSVECACALARGEQLSPNDGHVAYTIVTQENLHDFK